MLQSKINGRPSAPNADVEFDQLSNL